MGGAVNFCLQKSRMPLAGLVYFGFEFTCVMKIGAKCHEKLIQLEAINPDFNHPAVIVQIYHLFRSTCFTRQSGIHAAQANHMQTGGFMQYT